MVDKFQKLLGQGADTSKKPISLSYKHWYKEPDNFYSLKQEFGQEALDFIINNDIFDTKYYSILLKEWLYALKKGGLLLLKINIKSISQRTKDKDKLDWAKAEIKRWTQHNSEIVSFEEEKEFLYVQLKKTLANEPSNDINKWTFGIITLGKKNDIVEKMIQSIRSQKIPNYEIIICGTYYDRKEKDVKYLHFTEKDEKGWITKKKNLICETAKYPNLMIMHDRIIINGGWFEGMQKYGNNFEVLCCRILYNGDRAYDWLTVAYPYDNQKSRWYLGGYLEYSDWDPWVYVDGGSIIMKKTVWEKEKWDENLFWGQAEDLALSHRQLLKGFLIRFNPDSSCETLSFGHPVSKFVRKKYGQTLGGYNGPLHLVIAKRLLVWSYRIKGFFYNLFGKTYDPEKNLNWSAHGAKK